MTEKRFLSFIFIEGILLFVLGLCMLLLPKITTISFGLMLCLTLIIYGGYKIINAILTRKYSRHFILNIVSGVLLFLSGIFLFFAPMFNLILITSLIGVYFLLESISSCVFAVQTKNTLFFWWFEILIALFQFLLGLFIIMGLPSTALWVVGILIGINFLFAGMVFICIYLSTKYILG